jgi:hypothetical protein
VCSTISKEAAPVLYGNNEFAFPTFSDLITFSNALEPRLCGLVRYIFLRLEYSCVPGFKSFAQGYLPLFIGLRPLEGKTNWDVAAIKAEALEQAANSTYWDYSAALGPIGWGLRRVQDDLLLNIANESSKVRNGEEEPGLTATLRSTSMTAEEGTAGIVEPGPTLSDVLKQYHMTLKLDI